MKQVRASGAVIAAIVAVSACGARSAIVFGETAAPPADGGGHVRDAGDATSRVDAGGVKIRDTGLHADAGTDVESGSRDALPDAPCRAFTLMSQGAIGMSGAMWSNVALADLEGNGSLDIVASGLQLPSPDLAYMVLLGPDFAFAPPAPSSFPAGMYSWGAFVLDVDGDGKPDLLFGASPAKEGPPAVYAQLGQGDGTFGPTTEVLSGALLGFNPQILPAVVSATRLENGSVRLLLADVADDGNSSPYVLATVTDPGAGAFSLQLRASWPYASDAGMTQEAVSFGAAGDLNGDGLPDIVARVGNAAPTLEVLLAQTGGAYTAAYIYPADPCYTGYLVADVNGDGHSDVVAFCQPSAVVMLGHGDGSLAAPVSSVVEHGDAAALSSGIFGNNAPVVADFDRDGHVDLAGILASGDLFIAHGNGDGTFGAVITLTIPTPDPLTLKLAAGDLNGDGRTDLVAVGISQPDAGNGVGYIWPFLNICPSE